MSQRESAGMIEQANNIRTRARASGLISATGQWLPWLLFGLTGVLVALDLLFLALNSATPEPDTWGFRGAAAILALAFAVPGQLLARRRPENSIGWIFLACALLMAFDGVAADYAAYAVLTLRAPLPAGVWAGWIASWLWPAYIGLTMCALLLFPTGRLPSSRWQPIVWLLAGSIGFLIVPFMVRPGPLWFAPYLQNPVAIVGSEDMLRWMAVLSGICFGLCTLAVVAGILLRLRQAQGIERQQLKWFAYVTVLVGAISLIYSAAAMIVSPPNHSGSKVFQVVTIVAFLAIPLVVGLAIQRYRLYDIDRIIDHTLVYGTLSAGVVLTYILIVGFLGTLLKTNMDLAAAIITAAMTVLLFRPLRARVQRSINRAAVGAGAQEFKDPETIQSHAAYRVTSDRGWLVVAQLAWLVCAALALLVFLAALPLAYGPIIAGKLYAQPIGAPPWYIAIANAAPVLASILAALISLGLAALIFWKKRDEPMALFVSFCLLAHGIMNAGPSEYLGDFHVLLLPDWISQIGNTLFLLPVLLLYLFPNGRFVPGWTRWAAGLLLVLIAPLAFSFVPNSQIKLTDPRIGIALVAVLCLLVAGIYAQVYRFRHSATAIERQQIKWGGFGVSLYFFIMIVTTIPYLIISNMPTSQTATAWAPWGDVVWWSLISILPVTLAVAVMRHRLWDIDLIIHRTLVYGALSIGIVALYILLVGALGALSQTSGNLLVSLLATGLIAVLFQPLRERLQRGVNRLLYGERDEPYALMARLGQNLETTPGTETVLVTLVRTISQALKLPYVAIETGTNDAVQLVAAYGQEPKQAQRIPLTYQGERLGELLVAPRETNEPLSGADLNLLRIVALQAGMAVHAVQLGEDLQRSRERLVVTREEERRRIRRDLHDGLGPALASLAMQADDAREWVHVDPDRTEASLAEIAAEAQAALQDIRRLVYDLRPPALDELGLLGALRQKAANSQNGLRIEIEAPDSLPPLSAAVEVAAYRIAQETLTNVARHSAAHHCTVQIAICDDLRLEICDDGVGLPPDARAGVGLISMRERAAELGGSCVIESRQGRGTCVVARLPLARD